MTDFRQRMGVAYHEAMESSHHSALVAIHVGPDIWKWMKEQTGVPEYPNAQPYESAVVGRFAGFPVVLEPSWATEQIEVHTRKVIA